MSADGVVLYDRDADIFDPYVLHPQYKNHQDFPNAFGNSGGDVTIRVTSPHAPPRSERDGAWSGTSSAYREELEEFRYGRNARVTRDPKFTSTHAAVDIEDDPEYRPVSSVMTGELPPHNRPVLLSDNHITRYDFTGHISSKILTLRHNFHNEEIFLFLNFCHT